MGDSRTPLPVAEVTVGDVRRWLSAFSDDAILTVRGPGGFVAPEMALNKGVRSVRGHYKRDPEGGLYFVSLEPDSCS